MSPLAPLLSSHSSISFRLLMYWWHPDEWQISNHAVVLHHSVFVLILDCYQDVKPGDVMQKKNLWEEIKDSSKQISKVVTFPGRPSSFQPLLHVSIIQASTSKWTSYFLSLQASAASKKYKFVVTGHGKYQKMVVEEDGSQSGEFLYCVLLSLYLLCLS